MLKALQNIFAKKGVGYASPLDMQHDRAELSIGEDVVPFTDPESGTLFQALPFRFLRYHEQDDAFDIAPALQPTEREQWILNEIRAVGGNRSIVVIQVQEDDNPVDAMLALNMTWLGAKLEQLKAAGKTAFDNSPDK